MKISDTIKDIMHENGLSQIQIAQVLKVSQKAISNWINNIDKPNSTSLLAIYENFGITPNEILSIETKQQQYSTDEQTLLRAYRNMSPGKKKALFQMLDLEENEIKQKSGS